MHHPHNINAQEQQNFNTQVSLILIFRSHFSIQKTKIYKLKLPYSIQQSHVSVCIKRHTSDSLWLCVKLLWFCGKKSLCFIVVVNQSAVKPLRLNAMT